MRHFFYLAGAIMLLAGGVGTTAAGRGLIALPGCALRVSARSLRTAVGTVALTSVTVAADEHLHTAAGTAVASSSEFHRR